ncbi:MAG: DUF4156 domain-containing protein [Gammaproteobacteria bacterium]|nr:DUF4156 domain-containing protein [Gammaproteobacteria bacterium]
MKLSRNVLSLSVLCLAVSSLAACTWVEPTKESSNVTLVKDFNVKSCKKLSTTTTSVASKIGIIERNDETITDELITLAKNKAAELGGDSIVAKGPATDGSMTFDVYKCGE